MKKTLLIGMIALSGFMAKAQTAFFESVPYKGAFAPQPATPWTAGWTNFDCQNTVYPATTVNVPGGDITTNTTWTANNVYLLDDGYVYVTNGATLTIEAGTIIRGRGKGTLIICRGAKVNAQGTAQNPIVFTSNEAPGDRDYGDWGGVVILGAAQHNISTGPDAPAEGGIAKPLPSGDGRHGGNNDDDNSGVFSYCRIEFCGIPLTTASNSEINGLTLYSVGRQTKIDHVQVSYCGDDSFEWFGGTVDAKYLVAYKTWDDDFDTDNGFRGRIQFAVAFRDSRFADQSGSCGFESDNDNAGSNNTPVTAPVFSNVTIIGPNYTGNPDTTNTLFTRSVHHRRNSRMSIFNSIITGWPTGYTVDRRLVSANLCTNLSDVEENIIAGMTTNFALASNSDTLCISDVASVATWFGASPQNTNILATSNAVNLVNPFGNNNTNPDFRPTATSPAVTGALFTNNKLLPLAALPALTTTAVSGITGTNAESGGNITSDGNLTVTQRGITWGTTSNPTIAANEFTNNGTGTGSFTASLTGLSPETQYYVRAYAINALGVAYGNEETFTTTDLSIASNALNAFVIVYPNPAENEVNISINSEIQGMIDVQLIDLNGRVVKAQNQMNLTAGNNNIRFDVSDLSAGIYTLRLTAKNGVAVHKVVIR